MIYYPISDDFGEFDDNDDGLIEYEEFAFDFLARWQFQHPEQLRKMFKGADTDGNCFTTIYVILPHHNISTAILPKKSSCKLLAKECALSTGKLPRRLAQEQCG